MMPSEIINGDCLEVMRGISSGSVDAVVVDPPYGIEYQSAWRTDKSKWKPVLTNDDAPFLGFLDDAYRVMRDGGALFCFCRWDVQEAFRDAIAASGFVVRSQVIWDREAHGMGDLKGSFAPCHDVAWFASKGRFVFPGKRPKTVLRHMRISGGQLEHPTQKPVSLMVEIVAALTSAGDLVLDPCAGSGSTGVACAKLGRNFIGIELSDEYADIARRRIAAAQPEQA